MKLFKNRLEKQAVGILLLGCALAVLWYLYAPANWVVGGQAALATITVFGYGLLQRRVQRTK